MIAAREAGTYWRQRDAGRTAGRAIHVEIDDETWTAFKRRVTAAGGTVGVALGGMVPAAAYDDARFRRTIGELNPSCGAGRRRFVRIAVDDDGWRRFKAMCATHGVSVAAAVGRVVVALVRPQPR